MEEILQKSPMFKGFTLEEIKVCLKDIPCQKLIFHKNDMAYDEKNDLKKVAFMLSGKARVEKHHKDGSRVIMKRLTAGNMFGVLAVFTDKPFFPTSIIFEDTSEVVFLDEGSILKLLNEDKRLLKNYLRFINHQVKFLFQRIEIYTAHSIEKKILQFFEEQRELNGADEFMISMSKSELAEFLGISRASLYRVLEQMEEEGLLSLKGRKLKFDV